MCAACSRLIPLRLGRQAYVCRDCGLTTHKVIVMMMMIMIMMMTTHKACHTRVDYHCPRSSLEKMEL